MQNNHPKNYFIEDGISLNEIISILIASKKIIIITTLIFTLIAAGYEKPSYIASSVIKVGFYTDSNNNKVIPQNSILLKISISTG